MDENYEGVLVPKDLNPYWGKSAYAYLYDLSGERDFPIDMSSELQNFIKECWQDANRPSWLLLSEIKSLMETDDQLPGMPDTLFTLSKYTDDKVRLVFWADQ
ncbi:hypothetical protein [Zooshikella ganghwensis]|uniref:hypothetical protein n=1 Tax=Zooshikella ganghwensis TaxID=202772 RepID=UPI000486EF67|nr:hypothetical protein [Zooshikella ganghwensis]